MNGAVLLCAAAVVLPIAACEVRRKWRDLHRRYNLHGVLPGVDAASVPNGHPVRMSRANPSVERIEPGKDGNGGTLVLTTPDGVDESWIAQRIAAHRFTPGPVWIGSDQGSGDANVVHSNGSYSCGGHSASGTSHDISSDCGGGQ